jgi:hypothetical protein
MEPITELDARFSSPDADAASWEAVRQVISEAQWTRIGFLTFYLVPLAALASSGALSGLAIWSTYACTRGIISMSPLTRLDPEKGAQVLTKRRQLARHADLVIAVAGTMLLLLPLT